MHGARIFIAALLAVACAAHAATIEGKVVAVADGDTLTVLIDRMQIKVRLAEIDAPQKGQAFVNRSRQSLAALCFGKIAQVFEKGKDHYARTLGRVHCDGIDANAEQVQRGMAWVFDKYVTDRSLYAVQAEAKAAGRGLWADKEPVPPWEWRRKARP